MKSLPFKPLTIALIVATVLSIGTLSMFSSRTHGADDKKTTAPKPALTVTTIQPSQAQLPIRLAANGNIVAWQEAIVGSESNGLRLKEVRAEIGDKVRAGEVLAVFADETVKADVAQARAGLLEAEANATNAKLNADSARALHNTGAMSAQEIHQAITVERTALAKVESAKALLAAQNLRLKQTQVLAPDDGVISTRTATVGAVAAPGAELFRMIRKGRLEWRAEVTSSELPKLSRGMTARIVAANGTELEGTVRSFAPTVDVQNRTSLVYVDLPTTALKKAPVKAGMFAKGEFDLGASGSLTVPQQAVVVRDGFSYVFRLNNDSRVSQVKVETGRRLGDRVEVVAGIKPDAVLVSSGAGFLNDGDLVKVVPGATPTAASGKPAAATSAGVAANTQASAK